MMFSVLMSLYIKDDPQKLSWALESIAQQQLPPNEIILIYDGPIGFQLEKVVSKFVPLLPLNIIKLPENVGLGAALQIGVLECQNDLILRADADDINSVDRFKRQVEFFNQNPEIDLIGSWITEYETNPKNIVSKRTPPINHSQILKYGMSRNPFNHMSVAYKKPAILKAGNYAKIRYAQDYELWVRMLLSGAKSYNIPDYLVNASAGAELVARRGGIAYLKNEIKLMNRFYSLGYISKPRLIYNILVRGFARIMPNKIRYLLYRVILRK